MSQVKKLYSVLDLIFIYSFKTTKLNSSNFVLDALTIVSEVATHINEDMKRAVSPDKYIQIRVVHYFVYVKS